MSIKKKIAVVILLVIIFFGIQKFLNSGKPTYTTVKAEKGNVIEVVAETGKIVTSGIVDVYSPSNGTVKEVYIANGEETIKGKELFKVESSATEQEQQAAYATYLTAAASLNAAKSNLNVLRSAMYDDWDTYYNLATGDTYENADGSPKIDQRRSAEFNIAQSDWYASEAKLKDQQTVVSQAQAQSASTWNLYQATQNATVKAPSDGIVSNLAMTIGSSVTIYSVTLTSNKPVLTISKPGTIEAVVSLSETDIAKVNSGQEATVEINAISNKKYKGIVRRVDDIGKDNAGVIRYNVYIEVLDAKDKILSGMTADAEIETKKENGVLTVPNSAVKPYQGGRAVRVIDKTGEIQYIPVEIGIRGINKTQIIKGISEGQEVITALSNEQIKRPGLFGN